MKASEFRKLIREEVRRALKEANEATLSQVKVGDKFVLAGDALVKGNQQYYPLKQAKYSNVQFQVVKILPKSIVTIPYNKDGKYPKNVFFKKGAVVGTEPVDTDPILPESAVQQSPNSLRSSIIGMIGNNWEAGDAKAYESKPIWTVVFVTSKGDINVSLI
jgi:hypothetical protein